MAAAVVAAAVAVAEEVVVLAGLIATGTRTSEHADFFHMGAQFVQFFCIGVYMDGCAK